MASSMELLMEAENAEAVADVNAVLAAYQSGLDSVSEGLEAAVAAANGEFNAFKAIELARQLSEFEEDMAVMRDRLGAEAMGREEGTGTEPSPGAPVFFPGGAPFFTPPASLPLNGVPGFVRS
jgi:hypothetical protein